jgi:drug/metabolite transporter (DMT)-like permease
VSGGRGTAAPPTPVVVLFVVPTLLWGTTWYAITFQLGSVAPEVSIVYRFALAAVLIAAWCAAIGRRLRFPPRAHAMLVAQGALYFGLNYIAVYRAEQYVASGLVAVVFSTIAFMAPVAARIAFGTPLARHALAGAALGIAGIALLFLPELAAAGAGGATAAGVAFALGGTVMASLGTLVTMRMQRRGLPILETTAWGMGYGALWAALTAALGGAAWTFDAGPGYVASLAYLAVFGSVAAFLAYLTLLKRAGPGPASYTGVVSPVVAMALSTLFEGYRWTVPGALGAALAVAGNVLVLRKAATRG